MSDSTQATIKVVSTNSGFRAFIGLLSSMFMFLLVFIIGIVAGASALSASNNSNDLVQISKPQTGSSSTVAVLDVSGVIDSSTATYVHEAITEILDNKNIRAVVLRVDSPGGEVTASDEIWHELQKIKKAKIPIVASYGSMATSGGYYISCHADSIMAQETTVTGSIGVIINVLTFQGLLEKLGVDPVTLIAKDSPEKSIANDVYRNWTIKDKQKVRNILNAMYSVFYERVKEGRSHIIQNTKKLKAVANGSAYTAHEALENGLIDSIGYLDDAIELASLQAGIVESNPTVLRYSRSTPMFGGLLGLQANRISMSDMQTFIQNFSIPKLMYIYSQ